MGDNAKTFLAQTDEEVKMIFDPLRLKIISTLAYKNEEMTVKQIATEIDLPANKVHYHVKKLYDFGALELKRTENINGIIAKYYNLKYEIYAMDNTLESSNMFSNQNNPFFVLIDDAARKFKDGVVSNMELVAEQGTKARGTALVEISKLYMTREEEKKLVHDIYNVIKKYSEKDESKEVYSLVNAIVRIK
ncbi:helix-turn-helix domain-containing protein [Candidatus Izimaplasma bacterium]|nr:helix-turn-helix domain-containing protein [Candidatus Izimaplasma bacterium]